MWVALTVDDDRSGRLRSGESLDEAVRALEPLGIDALLLNCSTPEAIDAAWPGLAGATVPTGVYANAFTSIAALEPGGTVAVLEARTDLGPQAYAERAAGWVERGATIVGGCCETTPAHVRALAGRQATSSLADVTRASGLPKSTVLRLLTALEEQGAVQVVAGR